MSKRATVLFPKWFLSYYCCSKTVSYLQWFPKKQLEYFWCTLQYLKLWYVIFFLKCNNIKLKSQQNRPDLVLVSVVKGVLDQEVF